jgi:hypothetical protein
MPKAGFELVRFAENKESCLKYRSGEVHGATPGVVGLDMPFCTLKVVGTPRSNKEKYNKKCHIFKSNPVIKMKQGGYKCECDDHGHQAHVVVVAESRCLLVDLLVNGVGSIGLLLVQKRAQPRERLVANDENGGNGSLSVGDETSLLDLLDLGVVHLEDVVLALKALLEREQNESAGILVELVGRLLDSGELLIDAIKGLVA